MQQIQLGETITGPVATAQHVIPVGEPELADHAAHIATWFITAPNQSPAWDKYVLSVVHLRAIEGQQHDPIVRSEGATHEFLLYACEPDSNPRPDDLSTWHALRPLNLEHQVRLTSDEDAADLARLAAQAVCRGLLWAEPPLSGQTEPWASTLNHTAAHYRGEHDHEDN